MIFIIADKESIAYVRCYQVDFLARLSTTRSGPRSALLHGTSLSYPTCADRSEMGLSHRVFAVRDSLVSLSMT